MAAIGAIDQIKAGDFTGDGNADLVISRIYFDDSLNNPQPIQVLAGDGKGGFTDQTSTLFDGNIPTTNYVARMLINDFNNDGVSDIYCVDEGTDFAPFTGRNKLFLSIQAHKLVDATSLLPQEMTFTHGASVGDVDNDGRIDILVNHLVQKANDMQMQTASGQFVITNSVLPNTILKSSNTWSALIDVNNDGWKDMLLGTWEGNPNPSQVFLNDGHGSFASSSAINLPRSAVNNEVVVAIQPIDLNGDNLPDLVLSVTNGGARETFYQVPYLQFLVNDGNGNFHDETALRMPQSKSSTTRPWNDWFKTVDVVDINHDGYSDIFAVGDGSTPPTIFMNDGAGKFTKTYEFPKGDNDRLLAATADVNNDGMTDFVIELGNANNPTVVLNTYVNQHIYKANFGVDNLIGSNTADTFYSGNGIDVINGGLGIDKTVYSGAASNYTISINANNTVTVKNSTTTDTLTNVERLQFSDSKVALDITGNANAGLTPAGVADAGQVFRLYQAAFNRAPDIPGLAYWIGQGDSSVPLINIAGQFMTSSTEFSSKYGSLSNHQFVDQLYQNVLHRPGDAGGVAYWYSQLDGNAQTRAQLLTGFSESTENQAAVIGVIQNGIAYS